LHISGSGTYRIAGLDEPVDVTTVPEIQMVRYAGFHVLKLNKSVKRKIIVLHIQLVVA
jgi:hypothetical protein